MILDQNGKPIGSGRPPALPPSSNGCRSYGTQSRFVEHDRTFGLYLLILIAVAGAICSAWMCCNGQNGYKNPAKHPEPKRSTPIYSVPDSVIGVRG